MENRFVGENVICFSRPHVPFCDEKEGWHVASDEAA